ncbi:hypothetical protein [Geothrix terrae]|uniref:hypothetical protein n=1 Tax=Geothrix terrae TaxID=2922720 RepID=UPI001FAE2ECE|nr:hypothetical protein [Geothrix terrae]
MSSALSLLLAASVMAGFSPDAAAATPPQASSPAPHPTGAQIPQGEDLTGKVLERLDASPYCYLRLKTAKGEVWTAVPEAKAEKGSEVTVANAVLMTNFESKTLKRTFAEVYFGTLATPGATPAGANPHGQAGRPAKPVKVGKVAKASGADARTVAEIWAQKQNLKGKSVTLRAKVVKFTKGIMGKNWLHLQDGSGDPKKGTNDLTATSQAEVAVGDTVTIHGVVQTDKDFGAGYTYAVIIEDAKVTGK